MGRLTVSSGVTRGFHFPFTNRKLGSCPLSFRILLPFTELPHGGDSLDLPFWKEGSQTLMLMVPKNVGKLNLVYASR
jgi:hypothetical protein